MKTLELLSVGIDVGTTTTQVIFSRLALVNRAAVSQVPRYEFVDRKIIWQSLVLFTPVDKDGHLREEELLALVLDQYAAAGWTWRRSTPVPSSLPVKPLKPAMRVRLWWRYPRNSGISWSPPPGHIWNR